MSVMLLRRQLQPARHLENMRFPESKKEMMQPTTKHGRFFWAWSGEHVELRLPTTKLDHSRLSVRASGQRDGSQGFPLRWPQGVGQGPRSGLQDAHGGAGQWWAI